jgi:hypothetical protein
MLLEENAYSDVVLEAQEVVELALKGMLRQIGIEPPKWHDVGQLILEYRTRFPDEVSLQAEKLAEISAWLRTPALHTPALHRTQCGASVSRTGQCQGAGGAREEREFAFYGDIDFIPTERYSKDDAQRAIDDAKFTIQMAELTIK